MRERVGDEGLSESQVPSLARPEAYPHDPSAGAGIAWVQTHISHVFLTGERVYKLRKPVSLGFVDFGTRIERNRDCLREVRLNRRLAPDVYLGVAPLEEGEDGVCVGPVGEELRSPDREHCVVMRRLPDGRDAQSLLEAGALTPEQLDRVARRLAGFHARHGLGRPAPFPPETWIERITAPVRANLEVLGSGDDPPSARPAVVRLAERTDAFVRDHASHFEARRREGRAVDGHGDLHLQHVWFERDDSDPLLIDCIEFREDLRRIDAASDLAFLAMDLRYRHAPTLAERLLRVYAAERDDFSLYGVVDYYVSYRAAVRAKVALLTARESEVPEGQRAGARASARRHLDLAVRALDPRPPGGVVLLCGLVGSGKSSVARALAAAAGAVVIASDRVRKALAGLSAAARAGSGLDLGLYTPEQTEAVYAGLLERAEPVVRSGRTAILDATFSQARHREAVRRWARKEGAPFRLVEVRCSKETALRRLADRQARGRDVSEAGPDFYPVSAARFEPVTGLAPPEHRVLVTDGVDWRQALEGLARALPAPPGSEGDAGGRLPRGPASPTPPDDP